MTTTKKRDTFGSLLAALQAVYEDEIHRLVEFYRLRILAGEFSGDDAKETPRWFLLMSEIAKGHPWARSGALGRGVLAASRWAANPRSMLGDGAELEIKEGDALAEEVGVCLANDIMAVAAARRWVGPFREDGRVYELRDRRAA